MAALGGSNPSLVDVAKSMDPDGSIADVAELLQESNEILEDIPWMEGNLPTGHQSTVRVGIPTPTWRLINGGVSPTKSEKDQITEGIGMLEDWSQVDKDLAELNGNTAAFRLSEAKAHVEGMAQEFAQTFFYGALASAEEFVGLSPRYNSLSANNGQNILDAGGVGSDNSSIWLLGLSTDTICGIYPKGSKAGLLHENLGLQTVQTATGIDGAMLRAYQDHWQWKGGLHVKDWRFGVRIANIDISNLTSETGAADLIKLMAKAVHRIPRMNTKGVKFCWYMNRTVFQMLDIQAMNKLETGGGITYKNFDGQEIPTFRNFPVRICDQLLETESQVS